MKPNWSKLYKEYCENFTITTSGTPFELKKTVSPNTLFNWFKEKLTTKTRSNAQNAALHLYMTQLAEQLNNAGYTFTNALGLEIPFTMELIKESIWKPTQKELFNIESTTKLNTEMINKMIDVFSLHFGQKGIYVEFPNFQSFLNKLDSN
jgi:hypothetical protein